MMFDSEIPLMLPVTPFVGVWIEISLTMWQGSAHSVTPFVGVWIEIRIMRIIKINIHVTPFVGVWIEIACLSKGK